MLEQEVSRVQKKLLTRLDEGSVCGGSHDAGGGSHLQDRRMGRDATHRDVLRRGFIESHRGRLVSRGENRETKRE